MYACCLLAVARFVVSRDGEDNSLTADNRDTKDHRWKLMTGKDGYFSLVNNAQCLHRYSAHSVLPVCAVWPFHEMCACRLRMKDANTFSAGKASFSRCGDEFMFHFIDLDPFDNGRISGIQDAASKCQQMLGIRQNQLDRNKERADEAVRVTKTLKETTAAVARKYKR